MPAERRRLALAGHWRGRLWWGAAVLPALYLLAAWLYFSSLAVRQGDLALGMTGSAIAAAVVALAASLLAWPATRPVPARFRLMAWRADRLLVSIAATLVYGGLAAFALADALNAALALPAIESLWSLFSVPAACWLLLCRAAVIDRSPSTRA